MDKSVVVVSEHTCSAKGGRQWLEISEINRSSTSDVTV